MAELNYGRCFGAVRGADNEMAIHKRVKYLECLRVLSTIAVVFCHLGATAQTDYAGDFVSGKGIFYRSVTNVLHFCVPCFFMISGALLLNPEKDISIEKLLKRYILKYSCVLLTFGWFYAVLEEAFIGKTFHLTIVARALWNTLEGHSWDLFWYLYSLIGVLLCLPILRMIVNHATEKEKKYLLVVSLIFLCLMPQIEAVSGFKFGVTLAMMNLYCFYMLAGYWIHSEFIRIPIPVARNAVALCIPLIVISTYADIMGLMGEHALGFGNFESPVIALYSVCIFELFHEKGESVYREKSRLGLCIRRLSSLSFGIYVTHMIWYNVAFKLLKINPFRLNLIVGLVGIVGGVLVMSVITTSILKKIPGVNRLI